MATPNPTCMVNRRALDDQPAPPIPHIPTPSLKAHSTSYVQCSPPKKRPSSASSSLSSLGQPDRLHNGDSGRGSPKTDHTSLSGAQNELDHASFARLGLGSESPQKAQHASASPNMVTASPSRSKYALPPPGSPTLTKSPIALRFQHLHGDNVPVPEIGGEVSPRLVTVGNGLDDVRSSGACSSQVCQNDSRVAVDDREEGDRPASANAMLEVPKSALRLETLADSSEGGAGTRLSDSPGLRRNSHERSLSADTPLPLLVCVDEASPSNGVRSSSLHRPPPCSSSSSLSQDTSSLSQDGSFVSRATMMEQLKAELFHPLTSSYPCLDVQSSPREHQREDITDILLEHIVSLRMELEASKDTNVQLKKTQTSMDDELHTLTENLFEEAYKMVDQEKEQKFSAEKRLADAAGKIEAMEMEVTALKKVIHTPAEPRSRRSMVLSPSAKAASTTSLPPSLHFLKPHSQHRRPSFKKALKKTLKKTTGIVRSSSSKPQTPPLLLEHKERRGAALLEGQMDEADFSSFCQWVEDLPGEGMQPYLQDIVRLDVRPCLSFDNAELSERIFHAVQDNCVAMESVTGEDRERVCSLSTASASQGCTHRLRLADSDQWHYISYHCRNRIAAVCDFYVYIGYIKRGILKLDATQMYWQVTRFRALMSLARLSLSLPDEAAP